MTTPSRPSNSKQVWAAVGALVLAWGLYGFYNTFVAGNWPAMLDHSLSELWYSALVVLGLICLAVAQKK